MYMHSILNSVYKATCPPADTPPYSSWVRPVKWGLYKRQKENPKQTSFPSRVFRRLVFTSWGGRIDQLDAVLKTTGLNTFNTSWLDLGSNITWFTAHSLAVTLMDATLLAALVTFKRDTSWQTLPPSGWVYRAWFSLGKKSKPLEDKHGHFFVINMQLLSWPLEVCDSLKWTIERIRLHEQAPHWCVLGRKTVCNPELDWAGIENGLKSELSWKYTHITMTGWRQKEEGQFYGRWN